MLKYFISFDDENIFSMLFNLLSFLNPHMRLRIYFEQIFIKYVLQYSNQVDLKSLLNLSLEDSQYINYNKNSVEDYNEVN